MFKLFYLIRTALAEDVFGNPPQPSFFKGGGKSAYATFVETHAQAVRI